MKIIPKYNVEEITEVAMVERLMMMETKMTTLDELIMLVRLILH